MIKVSEDLKALYKQDSTHKNYFIVFRDKGVMLTNMDIVSESLSITESICSSGNFQVGLTEAAVCNVKVRMPDNVKGDEIFVFQTVGGYFEPEISYDGRLGIQLAGEGVARLGSSFTSSNIISGLDSARFDPAANYLVFARLKYVGNPIYLYLEAPGGNLSRMIYYLPPSLFSFKNLAAWSASVRYGIGEYVTYAGDIWESRTYDNAQRPSAAGNAWTNITHYVQIVLPLMGSNFTEYKLGVYINSDTSKYGAPVTGYATAYKIDAPVMPLGLFGIDSCRRDADSNLRDIVGYDRMNDVGLDTDVYLSKGANQYTQVGLLLDEAAKDTQIVIGTNLSREEVSPLKLADTSLGKSASIDPENVYEVTKQETYELDGQYKAHPASNDDKYYRQESILKEARYSPDEKGAYVRNEVQIVGSRFNDKKREFQTTIYQVFQGKICDSDGNGLPDGVNFQNAMAAGNVIWMGSRGLTRQEAFRRRWVEHERITLRARTKWKKKNGKYVPYGTIRFKNGKSWDYYYSSWAHLTTYDMEGIKVDLRLEPYVIDTSAGGRNITPYIYGGFDACVRFSEPDPRTTNPGISEYSPREYILGYYEDGAYPPRTKVYDGVTYNLTTKLYDLNLGLGAVQSTTVGIMNAFAPNNEPETIMYSAGSQYGYYFDGFAGNRGGQGNSFKLTKDYPRQFGVQHIGNGLWVITGNSNEANKKDSKWTDANGNSLYRDCYGEFRNDYYTYGFDYDAPDPQEPGCTAWREDSATAATSERVTEINLYRDGPTDRKPYTKGSPIFKRAKKYERSRRWDYNIPSPGADEYGGGWQYVLPSAEGRTAVQGNVSNAPGIVVTRYNYSLRGENASQIRGANGAYTVVDRLSEVRSTSAVGRYCDRAPAYEYLGRIYSRTVAYSYSFDMTRLPYPYRAWVFDRAQREGSYNRKDDYGNYNKSGDRRIYTRQQIGAEANVIYHRTDVYATKWRDYARRTLYYWKERALYSRTDYAIPEGVYTTELAYTVYLTYASDLQVFRDEKSRLEALIAAQLPEGKTDDGLQTFKGELTLNNRERFVEKAAGETTSEADVRPGSYFVNRVPYSGGLFSLTWIRAIQFDGYVQYPGDSTGSRDSSLSGTIYAEKSPFLYCIAHSKAEKFNGEQIKWSGGTGADGDTKHAKRRDVVNGFLNLHGMFINFDRWGVSTIRKVKASGLYPAEDLFPHDGKYTVDGETFPLLAYGDIYPSEGASETADASLCKSLYIEDETNNDFDGIYIAKPSVAEEEKKLYPFYYNTLRRRYGTLPRGMKETGYWESNNYFKIESNFYFNNFIFTEAQLKKICAFIIENVGQLKYYNLDAELRALPYLEVGDNIGIQTRDSGYETAILRRTMKGNMAQMDNIETDFYS